MIRQGRPREAAADHQDIRFERLRPEAPLVCRLPVLDRDPGTANLGGEINA